MPCRRTRTLTEDEPGLASFGELAERRIPGAVPWWWIHRVRSAVRR